MLQVNIGGPSFKSQKHKLQSNQVTVRVYGPADVFLLSLLYCYANVYYVILDKTNNNTAVCVFTTKIYGDFVVYV